MMFLLEFLWVYPLCLLTSLNVGLCLSQFWKTFSLISWNKYFVETTLEVESLKWFTLLKVTIFSNNAPKIGSSFYFCLTMQVPVYFTPLPTEVIINLLKFRQYPKQNNALLF